MISAVIPVYNEEESLRLFHVTLIKNLEKDFPSYEIIYVDDGSTDSSLKILKEFESENSRVKIISFRKNKGKAEALTAGFKEANGNFIVTLDADLQDRPEEIFKLTEKQKEGFDLVSGWRKDRKDSFKTVISSKLFNFIMKILWGVKMHDYNCGLKLYSKEAAKTLNLYGGMHRFIPLLVWEKGFSVAEVEVKHEERKLGKTKYGFSKIFKDLPDIFTILFISKYSKKPLHFFGIAGGLSAALGFLIITYLSILHFLGEDILRPLLTFGVLFILAGFQIFFTGILADLILHISKTSSESSFDKDIKYKTKNEKNQN
ncbi:MAG: glycosyltransferase family 2 protein [Elusimicrobia bacterium]|nr:glycosyltransferase family 2 protein [Elusimicrobiota bacterium]